MKRIGIITILKVNNYGAELQAYALQAILKKLGYDVEIIDYLFYKNKGHRITKRSKPLFKFSYKKKISEIIYPIITKLKEFKLGRCNRRIERFEQFHQKYTSLTRSFVTIEDLYSDCPIYDVYISGSDQIWNPGIYSSIKPYFLDFAYLGKRRIAYASSFGVESLPHDTHSFYREMLSKFDAIGVREKSGVKIINSLGLNAKNVLDPTLLLNREDWQLVSETTIEVPSKYVLVYEITPSTYINSVALEISNQLQLPIVRICRSASKEDKGSINVIDAGPSEFIALMLNATMVITNSFHGTAFAINFQKPFFVVAPKRKDNNCRQIDLLNLFDLSDRILQEGDSVPTGIEIDYLKVSSKLEKERKDSLDFLINAING